LGKNNIGDKFNVALKKSESVGISDDVILREDSAILPLDGKPVVIKLLFIKGVKVKI
jgi:hypothetical protein